MSETTDSAINVHKKIRMVSARVTEVEYWTWMRYSGGDFSAFLRTVVNAEIVQLRAKERKEKSENVEP